VVRPGDFQMNCDDLMDLKETEARMVLKGYIDELVFHMTQLQTTHNKAEIARIIRRMNELIS
jgi:hypothetical protein